MKLDLILLGQGEVPPVRAREVFESLSLPWRAGALLRSTMELGPFQNLARQQLDAGHLLEALASAAPDAEGAVVVGLTARDLFLPVLAYVSGLAPLGGRRAVVSLARLDPGPETGRRRSAVFRRRLLIEVVHEAGHAVGLLHCPVPACVMHQSLSAEEMDLKEPTYCPHCLRAALGEEVSGSPRN